MKGSEREDGKGRGRERKRKKHREAKDRKGKGREKGEWKRNGMKRKGCPASKQNRAKQAARKVWGDFTKLPG